VDFGVAFVVLLGLMLLYRIPPTPPTLTLPFFVLLSMITALGFGLWFSALNVRFRDIKHLIPFVIQIWMYVTPVVYSVTLIPERFRWVLALNPMTAVVEGFRWALLGSAMTAVSFTNGLFWVSVGIALAVFISGLFYFRSVERTFADII
jgi:lipopolysaccharide transport system permease protein